MGSPPLKEWGVRSKGAGCRFARTGPNAQIAGAVKKCQPDTKNTDHPDSQAMCDAMLLLFHNEAARLKKWGGPFLGRRAAERSQTLHSTRIAILHGTRAAVIEQIKETQQTLEKLLAGNRRVGLIYGAPPGVTSMTASAVLSQRWRAYAFGF